MEQAIFVMQGITITLMLYLDRARRADNAQTREEARADNAQLRKDMETGFQQARADNAQTREEARADNAQLRKDMESGFNQVNGRLDKLTDVVMDLCRRVGRLEGRAEQPG